MRITSLFLWLSVCLAACLPLRRSSSTSTPNTTPSQTGDLGNGTFTYLCVSDTDAACPSRTTIPIVAVGALFDLSYSDSSAALSWTGPYAESAGESFRITREGSVAFSATNRADSRVADFVHLIAEAPVRIAIANMTVGLAVDDHMTVEQTQTLRIDASSDAVASLAGAVGGLWASTDETVVQVVPGTTFGAPVVITALAAGTATVSVKVGELTSSVAITVSEVAP